MGRARFFRARKVVRAVSGITLAKRVILDDISIADITSANFDNPTQVNLLTCIEAQDEELESDGTNVATAPLYSRIVAIKLNLLLKAPSGTHVRWMLHKLPDGEELVTDANRLAGNFHASDDTNPMREFRKMQLAKGITAIASDKLATSMRVFVRKKALARVSPLRENDVLRFDVAKHADGTTATLSGFGTIWLRANG